MTRARPVDSPSVPSLSPYEKARASSLLLRSTLVDTPLHDGPAECRSCKGQHPIPTFFCSLPLDAPLSGLSRPYTDARTHKAHVHTQAERYTWLVPVRHP